MIRLNNDYNEIACSEVMAALQETTPCSYPGYGTDEWCQKAAQAILAQLGGKDAEVQCMIGGTQANATLIGAALRPWQSVISADCGHIFAHEAGSIEYTGHKILALPAQNAKLTAKAIAAEAEKYRQSGEADYLTEPKLVFLSSPSEYGTVYSKAELAEIRRVCDAYHLYLYLDGARLGYWLAMPGCDVTLADLAVLTDAFTIGGTKCGAMFGEALVLVNPALREHFRTFRKQTGGTLAKGWLLGLQFYTLFQNGLYFSLARRADELALQLKAALRSAGCEFYLDSCTNQQFLLVSPAQADFLAQRCIFEPLGTWPDGRQCVRLCTSWSTAPARIEALCHELRQLPRA